MIPSGKPVSRATTLGGVEKPKFVPKAQPKKAVDASTEPAISQSVLDIKAVPDVAIKKEKQFGNRERRDGGRGEGGRGGPCGREGRGRGGGGRWTMPTGVSFFTGNSANLPTSGGIRLGSGGFGGGIGGSSSASSGSSSFAGAAPNGSTDDMVAIKSEGISREGWANQPVLDDSDSDNEGGVKGNGAIVSETGSMDPVSLPFNAKYSRAKRDVPVLFQFPEANDAYIIQFPSELKLLPNSSKKGDKEGAPVPVSGKIGKLQVMKSGRVYLVSADGKKYEVTSGIDASFSQYVASISIDKESAASSSQAVAASSAAPPSSKIKQQKSSSATASSSTGFDGEMHILTNITRKLLLNPTHAIGNKRAVESVHEIKDVAPKLAKPKGFPQTLQQQWMHPDTFSSDMHSSSSTSAIAEAPKKQSAAKPSIRIRVSGNDKKSVAPSALKFTLSSQKSSDSAAPKKSAGSVSGLDASRTENISSEADYYANEFVDNEGGEDDADVE